MPRNVLDILRRTARRMTAARTVETAAVCIVAAGLWAAVLQVAWAIAWTRPILAAGLCAVPLLGTMLLCGWRRLHEGLRLDATARAALSAVGLPAAIGGYLSIRQGWYLVAPLAAVPAALLAGAAVLGALLRIIGGTSLQQAAAFLDERGQLDERMITALELTKATPQPPAARTVYDQALAALRQREGGIRIAWRRGPRTTAAVVLAVLLCTALAPLPVTGPAKTTAALKEAADNLPQMTAEQREQLAASLRAAAAQMPQDPTVQQATLAAARAVNLNDPEALRQAAEALRGVLEGHWRLVAGRPARALLAAAGGSTPAEAAGGERRVERPVSRPAETTGAERVSVWQPVPATAGDPTGQLVAAPVDYDAAWASARDRAAGALRTGRVRPEYRPIVRAFFWPPETSAGPR